MLHLPCTLNCSTIIQFQSECAPQKRGRRRLDLTPIVSEEDVEDISPLADLHVVHECELDQTPCVSSSLKLDSLFQQDYWCR